MSEVSIKLSVGIDEQEYLREISKIQRSPVDLQASLNPTGLKSDFEKFSRTNKIDLQPALDTRSLGNSLARAARQTQLNLNFTLDKKATEEAIKQFAKQKQTIISSAGEVKDNSNKDLANTLNSFTKDFSRSLQEFNKELARQQKRNKTGLFGNVFKALLGGALSQVGGFLAQSFIDRARAQAFNLARILSGKGAIEEFKGTDAQAKTLQLRYLERIARNTNKLSFGGLENEVNRAKNNTKSIIDILKSIDRKTEKPEGSISKLLKIPFAKLEQISVGFFERIGGLKAETVFPAFDRGFKEVLGIKDEDIQKEAFTKGAIFAALLKESGTQLDKFKQKLLANVEALKIAAVERAKEVKKRGGKAAKDPLAEVGQALEFLDRAVPKEIAVPIKFIVPSKTLRAILEEKGVLVKGREEITIPLRFDVKGKLETVVKTLDEKIPEKLNIPVTLLPTNIKETLGQVFKIQDEQITIPLRFDIPSPQDISKKIQSLYGKQAGIKISIPIFPDIDLRAEEARLITEPLNELKKNIQEVIRTQQIKIPLTFLANFITPENEGQDIADYAKGLRGKINQILLNNFDKEIIVHLDKIIQPFLDPSSFVSQVKESVKVLPSKVKEALKNLPDIDIEIPLSIPQLQIPSFGMSSLSGNKIEAYALSVIDAVNLKLLQVSAATKEGIKFKIPVPKIDLDALSMSLKMLKLELESELIARLQKLDRPIDIKIPKITFKIPDRIEDPKIIMKYNIVMQQILAGIREETDSINEALAKISFGAIQIPRFSLPPLTRTGANKFLDSLREIKATINEDIDSFNVALNEYLNSFKNGSKSFILQLSSVVGNIPNAIQSSIQDFSLEKVTAELKTKVSKFVKDVKELDDRKIAVNLEIWKFNVVNNITDAYRDLESKIKSIPPLTIPLPNIVLPDLGIIYPTSVDEKIYIGFVNRFNKTYQNLREKLQNIKLGDLNIPIKPGSILLSIKAFEITEDVVSLQKNFDRAIGLINNQFEVGKNRIEKTYTDLVISLEAFSGKDLKLNLPNIQIPDLGIDINTASADEKVFKQIVDAINQSYLKVKTALESKSVKLPEFKLPLTINAPKIQLPNSYDIIFGTQDLIDYSKKIYNEFRGKLQELANDPSLSVEIKIPKLKLKLPEIVYKDIDKLPGLLRVSLKTLKLVETLQDVLDREADKTITIKFPNIELPEAEQIPEVFKQKIKGIKQGVLELPAKINLQLQESQKDLQVLLETSKAIFGNMANSYAVLFGAKISETKNKFYDFIDNIPKRIEIDLTFDLPDPNQWLEQANKTIEEIVKNLRKAQGEFKYRDLQQAVKAYKQQGLTDIDLRSSAAKLQAEYDRIKQIQVSEFKEMVGNAGKTAELLSRSFLFDLIFSDISAAWHKTNNSLTGDMKDLSHLSEKIGDDVLHDLAEGSPGLTADIRAAWAKTTAFIGKKLHEVKQAAVSAGSKIKESLTAPPTQESYTSSQGKYDSSRAQAAIRGVRSSAAENVQNLKQRFSNTANRADIGARNVAGRFFDEGDVNREADKIKDSISDFASQVRDTIANGTEAARTAARKNLFKSTDDVNKTLNKLRNYKKDFDKVYSSLFEQVRRAAPNVDLSSLEQSLTKISQAESKVSSLLENFDVPLDLEGNIDSDKLLRDLAKVEKALNEYRKDIKELNKETTLLSPKMLNALPEDVKAAIKRAASAASAELDNLSERGQRAIRDIFDLPPELTSQLPEKLRSQLENLIQRGGGQRYSQAEEEMRGVTQQANRLAQALGQVRKVGGKALFLLLGFVAIKSAFSSLFGQIGQIVQSAVLDLQNNFNNAIEVRAFKNLFKQFERSANDSFDSVIEKANRLGQDLKTLANTQLSFQLSLQGTAVEDQSSQITESLTAGLSAFGLSKDKFQQAMTALQQIAGKSVVSMEELRQQLGEALPAATAIGARSMGLTQQEFNQLVASGNLLAEDFLPKFSKQLKLETMGIFIKNANSASNSFNRLKNEAYLTSAAMGEFNLAIGKPVFGVLVNGLKAIRENMQVISLLIAGGLVVYLRVLIKTALAAAVATGRAMGTIESSTKTATAAVRILGGVLKSIAIQFGIVLVAALAIKAAANIWDVWTGGGNEFIKSVREAREVSKNLRTDLQGAFDRLNDIREAEGLKPIEVNIIVKRKVEDEKEPVREIPIATDKFSQGMDYVLNAAISAFDPRTYISRMKLENPYKEYNLIARKEVENTLKEAGKFVKEQNEDLSLLMNPYQDKGKQQQALKDALRLKDEISRIKVEIGLEKLKPELDTESLNNLKAALQEANKKYLAAQETLLPQGGTQAIARLRKQAKARRRELVEKGQKQGFEGVEPYIKQIDDYIARLDAAEPQIREIQEAFKQGIYNFANAFAVVDRELGAKRYDINIEDAKTRISILQQEVKNLLAPEEVKLKISRADLRKYEAEIKTYQEEIARKQETIAKNITPSFRSQLEKAAGKKLELFTSADVEGISKSFAANNIALNNSQKAVLQALKDISEARAKENQTEINRLKSLKETISAAYKQLKDTVAKSKEASGRILAKRRLEIVTARETGDISQTGFDKLLKNLDIARTKEKIKLKYQELAAEKEALEKSFINQRQYAKRETKIYDDLAELKNSLLDKEKAKQERLIDLKQQALKLIDLEIKKNQNLLYSYDRLSNNVLTLYTNLNNARKELATASGTLDQTQFKGEIDRINKAIELRKTLANKDASVKDRSQARYQLKQLNIYGNINQLEKKKATIQDKSDIARLTALKEQQALSLKLLQIERLRAITVARRAIEQAKIEKLQSAKNFLTAQGELQKALLDGDKTKIRIAKLGLEIAQQEIAIGQQKIKDAKNALATEREISRIKLQANKKQRQNELLQATNEIRLNNPDLLRKKQQKKDYSIFIDFGDRQVFREKKYERPDPKDFVKGLSDIEINPKFTRDRELENFKPIVDIGNEKLNREYTPYLKPRLPEPSLVADRDLISSEALGNRRLGTLPQLTDRDLDLKRDFSKLAPGVTPFPETLHSQTTSIDKIPQLLQQIDRNTQSQQLNERANQQLNDRVSPVDTEQLEQKTVYAKNILDTNTAILGKVGEMLNTIKSKPLGQIEINNTVPDSSQNLADDLTRKTIEGIVNIIERAAG
ncbi:MAG: tape measure protein [Prochloraceae cyanobacterium]|nr:tape measure protein [Prochloraceae cyanobacterium]